MIKFALNWHSATLCSGEHLGKREEKANLYFYLDLVAYGSALCGQILRGSVVCQTSFVFFGGNDTSEDMR